MIPSVLNHQLRQGVEDFLETTFPIATDHFNGLVRDLFSRPGEVFKGPYLSLGLPFEKGSSGSNFYPDIPMPFAAHRHQEQSFQRLSASPPLSTLVATGTGSGKTECFLYPVLDHCYQHRGEPGVKVILIYPMNALASDQATRIAKLIYGNNKLRGNITAGLFIGSSSEKDKRRGMGDDHVIVNTVTQRSRPPDILLTNYKMLDYLLIRPKDRDLWQHNDSDTLSYLVVDELHSFDGAQGTDLSCLIRRLKARLGTPQNHLCCVGTSATLGDASGAAKLTHYATEVFGELFKPDSIITEQRESAGRFLESSFIRQVALPPVNQLLDLDPGNHPSYRDYISKQHELWFNTPIPSDAFDSIDWRIHLTSHLRSHAFFQNLLKVLSGQTLEFSELLGELTRITPEFQSIDSDYPTHALNSLLALVSEAKTKGGTNGLPFLQVRLQWWMRELRRMVSSVTVKTETTIPEMRFFDDLTDSQRDQHLPVVHCRECGSMGWTGLKTKNSEKVETALRDFYIHFFRSDPRVTFLFPEKSPKDFDGKTGYFNLLCTSCLNLNSLKNVDGCFGCGNKELVEVFVPNNEAMRNDHVISTRHCPHCGGHNSLTLVGSQAASLSSVLIAQIFASSFNDDKKLLTFSDSVQDAAHRAGFFSARTWRFNFRAAICQFIAQSNSDLTLASVPEEFIRHWSNEMDDNTFISTFIAPNMAWFTDFDHLIKSGKLPPKSTLRYDIERRIGWEIFSEFGFGARIGRTLEKSLTAIAHLKPDLLEQVTTSLLEPLQNEIGVMRDLAAPTLQRFIIGFITHMRYQGAVMHPAMNSYIEDRGNTYQFKLIPWMVHFGLRTRAPTFLAEFGLGERFDTPLSKQGHKRTWYQAWAERNFGDNELFFSTEVERFYKILLQGLVDANILEKQEVHNCNVWGINPTSLSISQEVQEYVCNSCGHNSIFEKSDHTQLIWVGALCLRSNCQGKYSLEPTRRDYYGLLYAQGDINRIYSAEHTGLLQGNQREELEKQFKAEKEHRKPWYPNLLSCTPTLEMGIDIGDLSSAILCSVPPTQANYLQRIGRAGRRDGNALNVTVANGRPHDLYFFADPTTMLAGHVDPPGVFLNASAVLERQFTAFCFDRWVQSGISDSVFPKLLGKVLSSLEKVNKAKFPHNLMLFIENHQTELLESFLNLFTDSIDPESSEHIKKYVEGDREHKGSLTCRVMDGLWGQKKRLDSLTRKVRTLKLRIQKKKQDPAAGKNKEHELEELYREKSAMQELVKAIKGKESLHFFTDEGLLPNYAFPEAGVVLQSIIYRRKSTPDEGSGNYDTWRYEYERSASSAIDELAPENTFYADGRKVKIDQVDMGSSDVEVWRFCSNCSFSELEDTSKNKTSCPRCGSLMWADAGQKRSMLRMRQVFATCSDRDSRIGDDSDDRTPSFYNKQTLVDFEDKHITDAWAIDDGDLPFGFEFLRKASFQEINFGMKTGEGDLVAIAGVEAHRKGFKICRYCGKVDPKKEIDHTLTCSARDKTADKNLIECLYLYREFSSEAIRILLPVTTFAGSQTKLVSFVAALQLGLKKKFAGNISHLQTAIQEEPVSDSAHRKRYLVLFDTVPGGTGYLKQLMRSPEPLMDVFALALQVLQECGCHNDPGKDGCYRCLFAYRNSYDMAETSRDTAIEILQEILEQRDNLAQIDRLKNVNVNSLFDSELEARFVEALRKSKLGSQPAKLVTKMLAGSGKKGYLLTIGEQRWEIEPQVKLGSTDNVAIASKADFLFHPVGHNSTSKPIVVFTDGYLYHRKRVGFDLAQRMAIVQSGKFHVWSLSWKDVENRFKSQGNYYQQYLAPSQAPLVGQITELLNGYSVEALNTLQQFNSFEWLTWFLANPDSTTWERCAFVHGLIHLDHSLPAEPWNNSLSQLPDNIGSVLQHNPSSLRGRWSSGTTGTVDLWLSVDPDCVNECKTDGMRLAIRLSDTEAEKSDGFESVWNGFIRTYNLFQFLPLSYAVTETGQTNNVYDDLDIAIPDPPASSTKQAAEGWLGEAIELADESVHALLNDLAAKGWSEPIVGYELAVESAEIVGEAELAWEDSKIAILLCDSDRDAFLDTGWTAYTIEEVLADPSLLSTDDKE
jgi:DEAD/DEAH box helicase domain-containing protein